MTRDLADIVKGLAEKAAATAHKSFTGSEWAVAQDVAAVFEPAIRDLIAQEREACAKHEPDIVESNDETLLSCSCGWIIDDRKISWADHIRARGGKA